MSYADSSRMWVKRYASDCPCLAAQELELISSDYKLQLTRSQEETKMLQGQLEAAVQATATAEARLVEQRYPPASFNGQTSIEADRVSLFVDRRTQSGPLM